MTMVASEMQEQDGGEISQHNVAVEFAGRIRERDLQLRRRFVSRPTAGDREPPLALMLRGGQGGQVRLKLYLSMLWIGIGRSDELTYELTYPAPTWAILLGLPEPHKGGARRIREALGWLAQHELIRTEGGSGRPTTVTLLDDAGTGRRYIPPGIAVSRARKRSQSFEADLYIKLPKEFWTDGWITTLSGSGVAMLLVLLAEEAGRTGQEMWFSPRIAEDHFCLSADTRTRGIKDLQKHELVNVERRRLATSLLNTSRYRNTYTLQLGKTGLVSDGLTTR